MCHMASWAVGTPVKSRNQASDHGVVTDASGVNLIVRWHLKHSGLDMGERYEGPEDLVPDDPCPFCKAS
jgi:hypothetical protein